MSQTFTCNHCGETILHNPRLKGKQLYCGKKQCQQARKNKWERDKLNDDAFYRKKRLDQKQNWRQTKPVDQYQKQYRETHPEYVKTNREQQKQRNKIQTNACDTPNNPNIVKTDTFPLESLLSKGLYMITPYITDNPKNIVKTDTLIVQLQTYSTKPRYDYVKSP